MKVTRLKPAPLSSRLGLAGLMDHAPLGILFTRNREFVEVNQQGEQMLGYAAEELIGQPAVMIYPDETAYYSIGLEASTILAAGKVFHAEVELKRRDGSCFWCRLQARAIDPEHAAQGTLWFLEDISEERALHDALDRSDKELTTLLNTPAVGILFVRERKILRCNRRFEELFDYPPGGMLGASTRILYDSDEDFEAAGRQGYSQFKESGAASIEWCKTLDDGRLLWVKVIGHVFDTNTPQAGSVWLFEDISEERQLRADLNRSSHELEAMFNTSAMAVAIFRQRLCVRANRRAEEMFCLPGGSLVGKSSRIFYENDEDFEKVGREIYPKLANGEIASADFSRLLPGGRTLRFRLFGNAIDRSDPYAGSIWFAEDITALHAAEEELRQGLITQQVIFDNAAIGILFKRDNVIQRCNARIAEMTGYSVNELVGQTSRRLYWSEEDYQRAGTVSEQHYIQNQPSVIEIILRRRDGTQFWARITSRLVAGTANDVINIVEDISEQHAAEQALLGMQEQLEARVAERTAELEATIILLQQEVFERMQAERRVWEMAHHDGLTGLPNRALLHDRLSQALEQAQREKRRAAVMFIDLDRFKSINDTLGHAVGDELLQTVAQRLKGVVRAVDTVSRLGGDEFVILLHEIVSPDDAVLVGEKVLAVLAPVVTIGSSVIRCTPSVGIAVYPEDGMDAVTLMKNADTAMYHAKAVGRNNFQFFSRQMNEQASRFFEMEQRLQNAIDTGQLLLHYQPLIDWPQRAVCGMEALVRWNDPEHGLISPAEFIPVAEETGLIIPLGEWVLRTALEQNRQWQQQGRPLVPVSINLSPRQFRQKDLVESVRRILAETGQPASLLELEITESSLMHDVTETTARLDELAAMGVRVAIDDFGTGYSSLAYLKRFPVHKLKVDQSFVRDLTTDPDDVAIVTTVIGLARSMKLDLLAEGVESEEQLGVLLDLGCRKFQGFFFSRPLPATAVDAIFSPPRLQTVRQ